MAHLRSENRFFLVFMAVAIISVLLMLEYIIHVINLKAQAYKTATVLLEQVEITLQNNKNKEQVLIASLKEDYLARAKAVSYIIDKNPKVGFDIPELEHIAELLLVDEIHLFDESGKIYGGTTPQYYGFTFDSGEQMEYFKPMLKDRTLSMCQDVTLNTAESKPMMYAICWNETKQHMLQVGITPKRLLNELQTNEISEVVRNIGTYEGITTLVAEKKSSIVIGSDKSENIGKSLLEIGVPNHILPKESTENLSLFINGKKSYCAIKETNSNIIVISDEIQAVNKTLFPTMTVTLIYLLFAALIIYLIFYKMTKLILAEQKISNTDLMTNMQNRRAYENELKHYRQDPYIDDYVYISMDLNGLKTTNDEHGHTAGDLLIQGAANVIKNTFGSVGKTFRIGGDEFVALIEVDDEQVQNLKENLEKATADWSEKHKTKLSISAGFVQKSDFPDSSIEEIIKIADKRMYQEKNKYYSESGLDRRKR